MRPSFARIPSTDEGTGNAGRALHPQPRVRNKTKHTSVVAEGSPEQPGIPCAMVYGLFRALPGDHACLPPSPARLLADLTPASERQDHTTSPSADRAPSSLAPSASTAS